MVSNTLYVHPSFVIDEPNFLAKVFNLGCWSNLAKHYDSLTPAIAMIQMIDLQ